MKKIITYGTYDIIHRGHTELLRRAREMGDYLIVGLSTDAFNAIKNKKAFFSYEERKQVLESIRYVDLVIPENHWDQKSTDIQQYDIQALVMGDDWSGRFDDLRKSCEVVYVPRTRGISTSMIKAMLSMASHGEISLTDP